MRGVAQVAFPRGRRGLKLALLNSSATYAQVAFPRGRRGLKHRQNVLIKSRVMSPSLAEGVD